MSYAQARKVFEIAPGGSCGFADAIAERRRGYTAVVTEPVRGLRIHREALIDGLEDHPDLAQRCLAAAASDLFELSMLRARNGEAAA